MQIDEQTKAEPDSQALFTDLKDGEAVVLHLQTHAYYGLNSTGKRIWELLVQGCTLGEIGSKIQEEYEIEADEATEHVREFTEELLSAQLVQLRNE